ncbi:hypothetical protein TWF106_005166 [Orbilia oligospora]|uniref:DUF7918 domain-containing protein n=1 Tax=Orbilia oligospora TaxID=2813651 RepID=A0A6G1LWZ4_ORBOL|nr:hypothetical protein TWF788_005819 [Orbilia oligospora]KAF3196256.1 hypothetical protein TWF106_005166 [Orbilia oligospora]KAF3196946.1 hypothetical protein TWF679_003839 [Orbilia oligospora]KAF3209157.1 hypothetical protein TWF191_000446 [Orbilia oligospora]KAF3237385.1 hypothetical protein TWF192_010922 [Orbilia oligospora]
MPTHKGVTITVHTPTGPLPEYKSHTRKSITTAYIAVPSGDGPPQSKRPPGPIAPKNTFPPSAPPNSFAISISISSDDYKPLTDNPQEHLAAYLFLDGKEEEAAAMLTRRRDTWISSRWCAMEDGSIGEKAFMWREVGLETFLGGLDLSREEKEAIRLNSGSNSPRSGKPGRRGLHRRNTTTGATSRNSSSRSPRSSSRRQQSDDGEIEMEDTPPRSASPSDNDDDEDTAPPAQITNTVGQIKLKLYRVLADGAPKYGVFEPKKDEEDGMMNEEDIIAEPSSAAKAEVSHTTGFAPAQKVDKDLIWSQTVTCLDPLSSPWATFIIFYRGERQLRKMGVIPPSPSLSPNLSPISPLSPGGAVLGRKRQSLRLDDMVKNLGKLPPPSTQSGFLGFRDASTDENIDKKKTKKGLRKLKQLDSDNETDTESVNGKPVKGVENTEEAAKIEEGIRKMKLKRGRATTPVPPQETASQPVGSSANWEWDPKFNTPPQQVSGNTRNGIHRRAKSAAGLLQQMLGDEEDADFNPDLASPNKKVKRKEPASIEAQAGFV